MVASSQVKQGIIPLSSDMVIMGWTGRSLRQMLGGLVHAAGIVLVRCEMVSINFLVVVQDISSRRYQRVAGYSVSVVGCWMGGP